MFENTPQENTPGGEYDELVTALRERPVLQEKIFGKVLSAEEFEQRFPEGHMGLNEFKDVTRRLIEQLN